MKITYHAATSKDEFIADREGGVEWLEESKIDPAETGLADFFQSIDGLLMGRKTYDFVFNYGSWPYEGKPCWVFSHRHFQSLAGAMLIPTTDPNEMLRQAEARGLKHLWLVGGGELASTCLELGLITHLSITELPVILKEGIPLFSRHKLHELDALKRSSTIKTGFRQLEYELSAEISSSG